jgi:NADH-quinone oxidoreductase subunit N
MKELLTLSLTGVFTMLADMFNLRKLVFPLALFGLAMTISWSVFDWDLNLHLYMVQMDNYALGFTIVMCTTALLWFMMSDHFFSKLAVATDRFALVFFALVGAVVMVSFTNLIMLFIGVEILSVSMYVLAGSNKDDISSSESAFKYFLMGAFASGFLLFGIALMYGVSGSFDLLQIRSVIGKGGNESMVLVGIIMLIIGLGFKVSAAPFHFWAPDVYEGAPTPITAFMATIVKTAAMASLFKLFVTSFPTIADMYRDVFAGMIVLTLLIGNVAAVAQSNIKRMLAFSSISHAGYMLIAVLCGDGESDNAVLFYAAAYSAATIVAFMILYLVSEARGSLTISAFNGLGKSNPLLAVGMTISMLSMAGIPPLGGFMAKYFLFANAISDGYLWLVLFAIAMSLIGVYYYFKVIIAMFFEDVIARNEATEGGVIESDMLQNLLIILGCGILLILGVFPQLVYSVL